MNLIQYTTLTFALLGALIVICATIRGGRWRITAAPALILLETVMFYAVIFLGDGFGGSYNNAFVSATIRLQSTVLFVTYIAINNEETIRWIGSPFLRLWRRR